MIARLRIGHARGSTFPNRFIQGMMDTLRAVQEVLTNTSRHAHARNLWIRLAAARHAVVLESRDDGRGADVVTLGNGLTGMRERFESQGGRVDIRSSESSGFEVHAYLPLAASA